MRSYEEIRPVSMLSFTMQVPWMSTASQGTIIPLAGITMTSPGTSSVDMACSISGNSIKKENSENEINNVTHRLGINTKHKWG